MLRNLIPLILLLSFASKDLRAANAFGIPDSDTAALIELVSLSISQVNELEQLVSNAEKYTKRIEQYNQLVMDHYYRALHILDLVESITDLRNADIKNLGDVNAIIRGLKGDLKSVEEYIAQYHVEEKINDDNKKSTARAHKKFESKSKVAHQQAERAYTASSVNAAQLTAQNTGKTQENTAIIAGQMNQMINKQSESNSLAEAKRKDELLKEKERMEFYGANTGARGPSEAYRAQRDARNGAIVSTGGSL